MKNTALKYGGISGLVMGVLFIASFLLLGGEEPDYDTAEVIWYTSIILSLLVIFVGIRKYRDHDLGGSISFGQAFVTGLGIAAVAAFILAVFDTAYITLIDPEFFSRYMDFQIETMLAEGASDSEVTAVREQFELFQGPVGHLLNGLVMFATVFLIGLIISLISSWILKKD